MTYTNTSEVDEFSSSGTSREGTAMWSSGRVRNAPTDSSSCSQIRETSDMLIPLSAPSATTKSATLAQSFRMSKTDPGAWLTFHHLRDQ